jgi:hypothetical protein
MPSAPGREDESGSLPKACSTPVFAHDNRIDESLLRLNDPRQFALRPKQIGNKTVRCNKPGYWPNGSLRIACDPLTGLVVN